MSLDISQRYTKKLLNNLLSDGKEKKLKTIVFAMLAFLLPLGLLTLLFILEDFAPFGGNRSILMIDMQSQYISYLRYYKQVLLGNQSFIYTNAKIIGGDFLSLFTYYMASPFNLLLVFSPDESIPIFFLLTNILKMSFGGLNFYLLMRYKTKKNNIGYLAFSVGYALISYSLVYLSNFMWLDGVMILPLCILGMELLMSDSHHYFIYALSLAYSLITSWYIGFMIALFITMYFIFMLANKKKEDTYLKYFARFIIFSLVGGLIAACCWGAAFLHLGGTKATFAFPSSQFASPSMFFTGFLENNYQSVKELQVYFGFATMFTGVISLAFYISFFFNKAYSIRYRLSSFALMSAFFFIISYNIINTLFHGGREPTWFPARYSFILGFIVCYFGALSFAELKQLSKLVFIPLSVIPTAVLLLVIFIPNAFADKTISHYEFSLISTILYAITALIISLYPFLARFNSFSRSRLVQTGLSLVFIALSSYSVYRGSEKIVKTNINENQYQNYDVYLSDNLYQADVDVLKEYAKDEPFYRMEMLFNRPGNYNSIDNNPMFYSYAGLNHFSSSEQNDVQKYFRKIGFNFNGFFEKYEYGSTLAINSLLGLKYLIDDTNTSINYYNINNYKPLFTYREPFKEIDNITPKRDTVHYYENTLALPLAFLTNTSNYTYVNEGYRIDEKNTYWFDQFEYQNEIFKSITDDVFSIEDDKRVKKDIFHRVPMIDLNTSSTTTYTVDKAGVRHFTGKKGDRINITYQLPLEGFNQNLYFGERNNNSNLVYRMDYNLIEQNYWHAGIHSIKPNSTGEYHLMITLLNDCKDMVIGDEFYYEDISVLKEYITAIKKQSSLDIKEKKGLTSHTYEGHININKKNQTLLFTLPNEKGIEIYIDGVKLEVETRMNIFAAAKLEHYSLGEHQIAIKYVDHGFRFGLILSALGIVSLILLSIYYPKFVKKFNSRKSKQYYI